MLLEGQLFSKANSRKIVKNRRTGKIMVIKSKEALKAFSDFVLQARAHWHGKAPLEGYLRLTATITYPSHRQDLDDSLLCDVLQAAGVIVNDRWIISKILNKRVDKRFPHVECTVEKLHVEIG